MLMHVAPWAASSGRHEPLWTTPSAPTCPAVAAWEGACVVRAAPPAGHTVRTRVRMGGQRCSSRMTAAATTTPLRAACLITGNPWSPIPTWPPAVADDARGSPSGLDTARHGSPRHPPSPPPPPDHGLGRRPPYSGGRQAPNTWNTDRARRTPSEGDAHGHGGLPRPRPRLEGEVQRLHPPPHIQRRTSSRAAAVDQAAAKARLPGVLNEVHNRILSMPAVFDRLCAIDVIAAADVVFTNWG